MKTHTRQGKGAPKSHTKDRKDEEVTCYKCGIKGRKARKCYKRVWCNHCKKSTHAEFLCKKKGDQDGARKVADEQDSDQDHLLKAEHSEYERPPDKVKKKGVMANAGVTSHTVNDIKKFKNLNSSFQPETYSVELADETKCSVMAQRR